MKLLPALFISTCFAASLQAQSAPARRVIDGQSGDGRTWAQMVAELAEADVVFVGEIHDDPNTHKIELEILQAMAATGRPVTLALEMFERDVQTHLTKFTAGQMAEADFLKASRPWPRYATDYKPMVDFAISKKIPVVAGNVPRPFASEVSKTGWDALAKKTGAEREWFAADLLCPTGAYEEYYTRFLQAMGQHPDATADRFYFAQCLKDETMAESVAQAWRGAATGTARPLVVHVNGAFHSDFHLGTASRVQRRLPGQRIAVVTVQAVADIEKASPDAAERRRGDFLVYTPEKGK